MSVLPIASLTLPHLGVPPIFGKPVVNVSNLPAPVGPQQVHPSVVVVVEDVVVVVVARGAVVVVVAAGAVVVVVEPIHEPPAPHASQQLGTDPTHAVPPGGALQFPLCLVEQVVLPVALVWQQVTKPGLPQVDCAAHCTTAPLHWGRSDPFSTAASVTSPTQLT